MKFGAIDIGTNAARLLIGEVIKEDGRKFVNKVSYTRIPLRLGESVFDSGRINKKKAEQFVKTMKAFQLISELFEVKELRACATSAMREAKNEKKIKTKILQETGIEVETISGNEEADLIFGTFFLMDIDKTKSFIVVDVGGGSTEISVFSNGNKEISQSFEIGTIRLLKGKTKENVWEEIYQWLDEKIAPNSDFTFYATGGNINKVHKLVGGVSLEPISFHKLKLLKDELSELKLRQRMEKYQLKPDRADVIVPALNIYCNIMEKLNCSEVVVPKIGLSDGIIYDLDKKNKKRITK
jgi:exopolyphosphatase/guanosine-5'-triphosphate,3'-diphosphate pyrophosphatase